MIKIQIMVAWLLKQMFLSVLILYWHFNIVLCTSLQYIVWHFSHVHVETCIYMYNVYSWYMVILCFVLPSRNTNKQHFYTKSKQCCNQSFNVKWLIGLAFKLWFQICVYISILYIHVARCTCRSQNCVYCFMGTPMCVKNPKTVTP